MVAEHHLRDGQQDRCTAPCCRLNQPTARTFELTFGQALSRILAARQITQYRLCQVTGLGADTVCRLVNDVREPTESQVLRIAAGLQLGISEVNRLLEAADFYPIPEPAPYQPTGRNGWPAAARADVDALSVTGPQRAR